MQFCYAGVAYITEVICAGEDVKSVTKPQPFSPANNNQPESAPLPPGPTVWSTLSVAFVRDDFKNVTVS